MKKKHRLDIPVHTAIEQHLRGCRQRNFSKHTLKDYENTFRHFRRFLEDETLSPGVGLDTNINDVGMETIEDFMLHMTELPISPLQGVTAQYAGTERGQRHQPRKRRPKTLLNYHVSLSSLWSFALKRGMVSTHIVRQVLPPRVSKEPISPLTPAQVVDLLNACDETRSWHNKPLTRNARHTAERDKALISLLLEVGIRASELTNLRIEDVTFSGRGGEVSVLGKGNKVRVVPFRTFCARFLDDYLLTRGGIESLDPLDPVFPNMVGKYSGMAMNRQAVLKLVSRLGKKIGIRLYPHKLRTTCACLLAANGMNAFSLQKFLGHESIETTLRYVRAANLDLREAMKSYSPLDNLRLRRD